MSYKPFCPFHIVPWNSHQPRVWPVSYHQFHHTPTTQSESAIRLQRSSSKPSRSLNTAHRASLLLKQFLHSRVGSLRLRVPVCSVRSFPVEVRFPSAFSIYFSILCFHVWIFCASLLWPLTGIDFCLTAATTVTIVCGNFVRFEGERKTWSSVVVAWNRNANRLEPSRRRWIFRAKTVTNVEKYSNCAQLTPPSSLMVVSISFASWYRWMSK